MRFDIDNLRTMRPRCGGMDAVKMAVAQWVVFAGRDGNGGGVGERREGPILAGAALGSGNGRQWENPFAASGLRQSPDGHQN